MSRNHRNRYGLALTRALERREMSQRYLASQLGVTPGTISNWCGGLHYPSQANHDRLLSMGFSLPRLGERRIRMNVRDRFEDITIGRRFAALRIGLGWHEKELADVAGYSQYMIRDIEEDRCKDASALPTCCQAMGIDPRIVTSRAAAPAADVARAARSLVWDGTDLEPTAQTIEGVISAVRYARRKHPSPQSRETLALALVEEVGEVAKAFLDQSEDHQVAELEQVAAVAIRLIEEVCGGI